MAFLVNLLAVSVVTCSFIKHAVAQSAQVQQVDNAEQFALLCRIYNVARNPPINHVDLQDPLKIVKEIDAFNASLEGPKLPNETDQVENSSGVQLQPTTTREAAVAQAILRRITKKAHNILEEIGKLNTTRDIEKVKGDFAKVILGDVGNESDLCHGALSGVKERAEACGKSGLTSKGEHAGKNLVVDFFCLCAQRTENNDGIDNVCSVHVGSTKGKHGWSTGCPSTSSTMWSAVKNECEKLKHKHPMSGKEGHDVLEDFLKHLKAGGVYRWGETSRNNFKASGRKKGMLGTGMSKKDDGSDILCDGKKGKNGSTPGGICVYYGPLSDWNNIDWLKKLRIALTTVDALNNQTATIQRNIEKLQMFLHRAEEIYETTKVITEIQKPVEPTSLQTAAKRLTAYNAAWRHTPMPTLSYCGFYFFINKY